MIRRKVLSLALLAIWLGLILLAGCAASKPTCVINAPPSGSQFREGDPVAIQSNSKDSAGVTKVELYVDGMIVASDSTPSPQASFTIIQTWRATLGSHTISVAPTMPRAESAIQPRFQFRSCPHWAPPPSSRRRFRRQFRSPRSCRQPRLPLFLLSRRIRRAVRHAQIIPHLSRTSRFPTTRPLPQGRALTKSGDSPTTAPAPGALAINSSSSVAKPCLLPQSSQCLPRYPVPLPIFWSP